MKTVFADTGYWIALVNPNDDLHQISRRITHQLMPFKIVTSELVFNQLLNTFSKQGASLKQAAISLIKKSYNNSNIEIVPQTTELFRTALELYEQRPDQSWSHTDCLSFQIMRQNNILEALAYDKHFE